MLSGKWNVKTQNPKYNLSASGQLNKVKNVTASFKGRGTNASISSNLKGDTSVKWNKELRGNSSLSANIHRPRGGGGNTYYGITYKKGI